MATAQFAALDPRSRAVLGNALETAARQAFRMRFFANIRADGPGSAGLLLHQPLLLALRSFERRIDVDSILLVHDPRELQ